MRSNHFQARNIPVRILFLEEFSLLNTLCKINFSAAESTKKAVENRFKNEM